MDGEQAPALSTQAEKENRTSRRPPHSVPQTQPLCHFYSQGRHCHFGRRCRFLHQRGEGGKQALSTLENKPLSGAVDGGQTPGQESARPPAATHTQDTSRRETCQPSPVTRSSQPAGRQRGGGRPCRYFLSGYCAMEERCRFVHPQQFPPIGERPGPARAANGAGASASATASARIPVARPHQGQQEVKLSELTNEVSKQLRTTEIQQLIKRFPKDRLIVQEREDGKVTYYRFTVQPTDPDWPFDLKDLDVMVCFPDSYPQEVFTVDIPQDQDLPSVMGRHVEQASTEWLQAKHATNQLMGKLELLFRPYLRWLDRSMERLFIEGATKLKKDIDAERAGIQFVPYQQLQAAVCKGPSPGLPSAVYDDSAPAPQPSGTDSGPEGRGVEQEKGVEAGSDGEEEEDADEEDEGEEEEEEEEEGGSRRVENVRSGERRRGTEVKLLGLQLGEGTATVVARRVTVSLQCSRCKVASDLSLSGTLPCTAQCEKCGAGISAAFRPSMLHQYSDVLGYLDLSGVAPVDLVLQEAQLVVGCLGCSQEDDLQNVAYGQNKETNCQHCHSKLSIYVDSTRFTVIQPRTTKQTGQGGSSLYARRYRDPAIQGGKPLPDKGTCKHYKQSNRWLRFPCCGRAYPCDACHDEDQDHHMELATRMICGHCAKEQPFSNGKPCVGCGGMMTRSGHSSHWEGGLGCRSKVKMNRNDRQKYASTNKTISRRATSKN
ncbi:uncharacterized protein si:dkey-24l11.2 [Sardina pilchardus]|uniref:uncharacterized protein si:dkey-24l11.2 n=1 Tax=Sardina pilchardus TaxID=27697 RepID=UPI002E0F5D46